MVSFFFRSRVLLAVLLGLIFCQPQLVQADTWYVRKVATSGDGLSWATAFKDLREAIAAAQPGDEIWIAQNHYRLTDGFFPGTTNPLPEEYYIDKSLTIRGGFLGTETSIFQRPRLDPDLTVLDGDRLGDDGGVPLSNPADNTNGVMRINLQGRKGVLIEGIRIQGGVSTINSRGGGVTIFGDRRSRVSMEGCRVAFNDRATTYSPGSGMQVRNVTFSCRGLSVDSNVGGGFNTTDCDVTISSSNFSENGSTGFSLWSNTGHTATLLSSNFNDNGVTGALLIGYDVTATNCDFEGNQGVGATVGTGPSINTTPTSANLTDCRFTDGENAGLSCSWASAELTGCDFNGNETGLFSSNDGVVDLENCTFWRNSAGGQGGAIFLNANASVTGSNLIIAENGSSFAGGIRVFRQYSNERVELYLENTVFHANEKTALFIDGADNPGAMHEVVLVNPVFVGNVNQVSEGGAIRNGGNLTIYQGTFTGNEAVTAGDVISLNTGGSVTPTTKIVQSLFWDNDASGGDPVDAPLTADSVGNLDSQNPRFLSPPDNGDGLWTTFGDNDYGDLRLDGTSYALDAGVVTELPNDLADIDGDGIIREFFPFDVRNEPRVLSGYPDVGAYETRSGEFNPTFPPRSLAPFISEAWNSDFAGFWSGLLWHDNQQSEPAGSINRMTIQNPRRKDDMDGGLTSFVVVVEGRRLRFRGQFSAAGLFSDTIEFRRGDLKGKTAEIELQTGESDGEHYLKGTLTVVQTTYEILLARSDWHRRQNPATDAAGKFTSLLIPGATWTVADPTGHGAGTVNITTSGRVRLLGFLPDGSRYAWGGRLADSGFVYLWKDLYRRNNRGHLAGRFQIRQQPGVSDFDGFLEWHKPADPRDKYFPDGFSLEGIFLGSKYAFYRRHRMLLDVADGNPNCTLTLEPSDADALTADADWRVRGNVIRSEELGRALSLRGNARNGFVNGIYRDPETGEPILIRSVVFQKQGTVLGHLTGRRGTEGVFDLVPFELQE